MRIYACAAAAAVFLFAFVALAKSGSSDGAEQPWENPEVRNKVLDEAIAESKQYFKNVEANREASKSSLDNTFKSPTRLLAKFFKKPSEMAKKHSKARLLYDDMMHRAERKLVEMERATADSTQLKTEILAKELFHEPGSLLKPEEMAKIYQESGCIELRRQVRCNSPTVNQFRSIDGTCNNLKNPLFGSSDQGFRRLIPAQYEDGVGTARGFLQSKYGDQMTTFSNVGFFGPTNPSPRIISTEIIEDKDEEENVFTHILMQWGQFLDHDMDLGPEPEQSEANCQNCIFTEICLPIRVPQGDEEFGFGTRNKGDCLPLRRSIAVCPPEDQPSNASPVREQINVLTAFIDGSQIYGSNSATLEDVRRGPNGNQVGGGKLAIGEEEVAGRATLPLSPDPEAREEGFFLAGDIRVNEQIGLTIMHTIWLREHNRIAREFREINPTWSGERVFQETRRVVGAMLQKITYTDYLPKVLGSRTFDIVIGRYLGYDPTVDPGIPNAFAGAAYRYGHSLIRPYFDRLVEKDQKFVSSPQGRLKLVDAFMNPEQLSISGGTDPILRGMVTSNARRVDEFLNAVLTSQLFETKEEPGMDLASLNIQRGREHGIPPYPTWRNFCQRKFAELDKAVFKKDLTKSRLVRLHGSLDTTDLWIGGLSEKRVSDGIVGPTFACIFGLTFGAARDGDRFYYEKPGVFTEGERKEIEKASLSQVICDNTDINFIQPDAFRSDQSRVSCNSLPRPDLSVFSEDYCYFKVRVPQIIYSSRFPVKVFSRTTHQYYEYYVQRFSAGSTGCMRVTCPTSSIPAQVIIYSSQSTKTITSTVLPPSLVNSYYYYYQAEWKFSQPGVFTSLGSCQSSSSGPTVSFEYFSTAAAGAAANSVSKEQEEMNEMLHMLQDNDSSSTDGGDDDDDDALPDDILDLINTDNKYAQLKSEAAYDGADAASSILSAEAGEEALIKELEESLKELSG